jgi:hypothetical protein
MAKPMLYQLVRLRRLQDAAGSEFEHWCELARQLRKGKPGPKPRDNRGVTLFSAKHCALPVPASLPSSLSEGVHWGLENLEAEMNTARSGSFEQSYTSIEAAHKGVMRTFERDPALAEEWEKAFGHWTQVREAKLKPTK